VELYREGLRGAIYCSLFLKRIEASHDRGVEYIEHFDRGVCECCSRKLEEEKEKHWNELHRFGNQSALFREI